MEFVRNIKFIEKLDTRIRADSGLLQVLLGPRLVGKTTTVLDYLERTHAGSHHYVSADQEIHTGDHWIRQHWDYELSGQLSPENGVESERGIGRCSNHLS